MIRIARFCTLSRSSDRGCRCYATQYSKIERINATYMVVRSIAGTPPRRNTRRMCNRLDALETVEKICSSHLRLFWIVKPNTLWERTVSSAWPSIDKSYNWGDSLRMQTRSSLHFLTLSLNQLSVAHTWTDLRVDWVVEKLSLDRFSEVETSSTYFHILVLGETILKLLPLSGTKSVPILSFGDTSTH